MPNHTAASVLWLAAEVRAAVGDGWVTGWRGKISRNRARDDKRRRVGRPMPCLVALKRWTPTRRDHRVGSWSCAHTTMGPSVTMQGGRAARGLCSHRTEPRQALHSVPRARTLRPMPCIHESANSHYHLTGSTQRQREACRFGAQLLSRPPVCRSGALVSL